MAVFIYVQHLLGIGHLRRSVAIANSIAQAGIPVHLASGGSPVANLELDNDVTLIQLPPVRARDGNFSDLVDEHDNRVDENWWQLRQDKLRSAWVRSRAPILITESYPFARRMMRHELLPLLEESRSHSFSKINVCSVRDIPQPKRKSKRVAEVGQILDKYYDHVLVHGDKKVATLQETFPDVVNGCNDLSISYTGYVDTQTEDVEVSPSKSDVLVSAGGGGAGLHIYRAAIHAANNDKDHLWRLLIGPNIAELDFANLSAIKGDNVVVERNRSDFRAVLKGSAVSLSQAGYNTLVDVLRTEVASVLVPYAKDGEEEQTLRAQKFAAFGRAVVLDEDSLDPASLLAAVAKARALKSVDKRLLSLSIDGADQTAVSVKQWLNAL